jgi:3-oxoacyl-[acyl-carrier-protein] synthase II
MSPVLTGTPLAITSAGVVSPAGLGLEVLVRALQHGLDAYAEPEDSPDGYPPRPLWAIPDLEVVRHLGRKGLRHVDRFTRLGLVAGKLALEGAMGDLDADARGDTGVVLATNTGSLASMVEVGIDTLVQEKPYLVNPGNFPNVVTNACAGQIAIRVSLRSVNSVVSSGQAAIRFARMAIEQGRASRLLVGGVEELSPAAAWGWHLSGALVEGAPVGEGCALFLVEDAEALRSSGRTALAELLACEVSYQGTGTGGEPGEGLLHCVERALEQSNVSPGEVDVVCLSATNHRDLDNLEEWAVGEALGRTAPQVRVGHILGELYSASGAMQVAALLAMWREPARQPQPRIGLVTSIGEDGNVGCLVVREWR